MTCFEGYLLFSLIMGIYSCIEFLELKGFNRKYTFREFKLIAAGSFWGMLIAPYMVYVFFVYRLGGKFDD